MGYRRISASAVAMRMAVSIGVAALVVMATVVPAPEVRLSASSPPCTDTDVTCALILGGTTVPTPDSAYIDAVRDHFIAPTHPGQDIDYIPVTAPMEFWPITGAFRLVWLVLGPPSVWGLDGPAWPNEPLWKLSGLFDLSFDQSVRHGVGSLEDEMALHPGQPLVIYGYSQGAIVANLERRKLAEQYPEGTPAPDIDFVLSGDPNTPNGGIAARLPGLYIPILNASLNGPAPTDTQFDTVVINREYDGAGDFPLYPLNVISLLNALLGAVYVHPYDLDVSLPAEPTKSPAYQGSYGHTDYYLFETPDLPLFAPLRTLGVPEPVIDVVEPFFKVIVDRGYDRSIKPWEPTPARLIPPLNPVIVAGDLVNAVGEGITNAAAIIGLQPPLSIPTGAAETITMDVSDQTTTRQQATADRNGAVEQVFSEPTTAVKRVARDVADGVTQLLTAVGSPLPKHPVVTRDGLGASQRTVGPELAATRHQINQTIGTVKSVIGNTRTSVRSAGSDNGSAPATARPARKTPVRDAVATAGSDIKKVVTKVSHSIKTALSGKDDDNTGDGGEGAAG